MNELKNADALSLGRAIEPRMPDIPAWTNSGATRARERAKDILKLATPLAQLAGGLTAAAEVADGYRTDGARGAAFGTADAAIEMGLSSTGLGALAAIAFSRAGGTRTVLRGHAMQHCSDMAFGPTPGAYPQ